MPALHSLKFKFLTRKTKNGFTLIELLIVVAIIAVLLGVGSVSFTTARRQGRDATRQADLKAVGSALEQYFADNRVYPEAVSGVIDCSVDGSDTRDWGVDSFECDNRLYLQLLPADPTGGTEYTYLPSTRGGVIPCDNTTADSTCQQYFVEVDLERALNPLDIDCTIVNLNYCIDSPGFD